MTGHTPHPTQGSTPWAPRTAHYNAGCKSQDLLHWVSRERVTFGMPDQCTACAATQGIIIIIIIIIINIKKKLAVQGWERAINTLSVRKPQPNNTNP